MMVFQRIQTSVESVTGWKRSAMLFVAGAAASLSLPPANWWIFLFVAFPVLALCLEQSWPDDTSFFKRIRKPFVTGWWFGFGYFVISLYWIGASFLVEPDKFAVLLPLAVMALPAGLSIFWGAGCVLAVLVSRPGLSRVLALGLSLGLAEWLRGNILSGFPWNLVGFASFGIGETKQLAAFVGVYGLNLAILIWAFSPILLIGKNRNIFGGGTIVLSLIIGLLIGQNHLSQPREISPVQPVVRIVQPNIPQKQKWDKKFRQQNIEKYFALSKAPATSGIEKPAIYVWPETALPVFFDEMSDLKKRVADLLPEKSILILGSIRRSKKKNPATNKHNFFNSVLAVNTDGKIVSQFDKFHLVPFGEYLPGEKWFKKFGVQQVVTLPGGFKTGDGPQTQKIENTPTFSPLVCYEIIFSGKVVNPRSRPRWIVNVTNDGWFAATAGPHQHLAQARLRAIEEGLPVVRAANTGISAFIGPTGEIIKSLELEKSGIIDARLPPKLPPTFFSHYKSLGFWVQFICILMILTITNFSIRRKIG